jgi:hypothetical protein
MVRACVFALILCGCRCYAASEPQAVGEAFDRLYNFDFPGAHRILNRSIEAHPQEPLPYAIRASAYLFYELDRMGILESEFLMDDKKIAAKKKPVEPDPNVRKAFIKALDDAQSRADVVLKTNPNDHNALFAMCIAQGVTTDYMAFIEKHQFLSLSPAKRSNNYAQRLLRLDPNFYDAYLTAGLSEYLVGSLPFFIKWFVHFDNVDGSKQKGVENLQLVAREGHYLKPFAKILLGIIDLREKRPQETQRLLMELAEEYPANRLFRNELAKLNTRLATGAN